MATKRNQLIGELRVIVGQLESPDCDDYIEVELLDGEYCLFIDGLDDEISEDEEMDFR